MCAINGITAQNRQLVEAMNQATIHRGPDGSLVWEGSGVTLGHNRLAIIDLSERALQPMQGNSGRFTIVFNGEIYNYRELRNELNSNYEFKTESDTEVLLAAYEMWGIDMLPKLRGMFAFGIWDMETETLLLVRDQMGIKPLYYTLEEGTLLFSSELPAILHGKREKILDTESVGFYLSMEYVPGPKTLVKDVFKLPAGNTLVFSKGKMTITQYYTPSFIKKETSHESIYTCIDEAVKRQMVSDRPIGVYLSGGFDSSIVTHHMTRHTKQVKTYSVDFEAVKGQEGDSEKFNADARLAEKTARFCSTDNATLSISLSDVRSVLEHACAHANEPVANATAITQFLLSDFVRKDGTVVVLGGDGGDELFGGYTRHRLMMGAYLYQMLPQWVQSLGGVMSPRVGKLSTPFFTPLHRALMVKDEKKIVPFLQPSLSINTSVQKYFDQQYRQIVYPKGTHPLDVFMAVDRATWLPDECFIRSDYASMAHGLELRVPLVDLDVVKIAEEISIWKKTLPHQGKRVIRDVYKNILPSHLYNQPKRGWLSPAAKWFRDPEINAFAQNVFSREYYDGLDGLFDWDAVQRILIDHVQKKQYALYPLWNILVLQIWARENSVEYRDYNDLS